MLDFYMKENAKIPIPHFDITLRNYQNIRKVYGNMTRVKVFMWMVKEGFDRLNYKKISK